MALVKRAVVKEKMRRIAGVMAGLAFGLSLLPATGAQGTGSRIKDIAMLAGARDNQLVGYGLVSGLAGDGDKNPIETIQTIANLLQHYGLTTPITQLSSKNVAIVMVTADIPAFSKPGSRLDVVVSSMGDAKSLQGGVLIQTPLLGADGKVYAVAQGTLSIGGLSASGEGASVSKNHPTVGTIINGALVEREIPMTIVSDNQIEFLLREADFTSAARMAEAVNAKFPESSTAVDSTTVRIQIPTNWVGSQVDFISSVEELELVPDVPARVIINERTGTIVATSHIHISSCAVSHGNVTISIATTQDVSQPGPLSQGGTTVVTPRTDATIKEDKGSMVPLPDLPTVEKVASALNALGVSPRDMMSMFEAMKQAGALQAELIMR
jgi:flagellar P-ring protein precursor FlgI